MMLNHLISNRLTLSLLLAISCSAILAGCQFDPSKNSTLTASSVSTVPVIIQKVVQNKVLTAEQEVGVIDTEATEVTSEIETATKANTLQWASNYEWKLIQVKDQKNNVVNINTDAPITLEVAPSSLSLAQGCQHFIINFRWMQAPPFEYGSVLNERPSDCKNTPVSRISETNIKALFPKGDTLKLDVELLPLAKNLLVNTQLSPKNLIIKIENGNTLTFDGTPKTFKKPSGLPIDKALLERYDWKLKSAVHNNFDDNGKITSRESIGHFYHPDFPVSLKFRGYDDSQYALFNANCNSIGGPYILMKDHTLLVGSGPQTMMGCGVTGNRIEGELAKLISNSKSTLSLSLQPSNEAHAQSDSQSKYPRYNLLQTMITGETLVWQNIAIPDPKPYPNSNLNGNVVDDVKAEAVTND